MLIGRHSFIRQSKLSDVAGRIDYISNPKRQEHLYAIYQTEGATPEFWKNLARENQLDFKESGTTGKCIEGREFIIALPESFVEYEPDDVVRLFTDSFRKRYDVECSVALHYNKKMTNYHIHLVFSERKILEHPEVKIATRNMFYDEQGKHRRTKKEILDEQGNIRAGCSIIPKGEVYESHIFTKKEEWFKSKAFTREVKEMFTEIINCHVKEESEKLSVFQQGGVYLATKKIGKNNPKEAEIRDDNAARQEWNDMWILMDKLQKQSQKMKQVQQEISSLKKQISETKGFFKGKEQKSLESKIKQTEKLEKRIHTDMGQNVKQAGYSDIQSFTKAYHKSEELIWEYNNEMREWKNQTAQKKEKTSEPPTKASVLKKLHSYRQEGRQQPKRSAKKSKDVER